MTVRLIRFVRPPTVPMPISVHTVGYNKQNHMTRPDGFSTDQLLFVRSGQGKLRIAKQEQFVLGESQYVLLPAGLPHEYFPISRELWEVGYISFEGTDTGRILAHFGLEPCRPKRVSDIDTIWRTLDAIWEIGDANGQHAEWEAVRLLYGLFLDIYRLSRSEAPEHKTDGESPGGGAAKEVVYQAALYLTEHYNQNLTLSNVSASLGYTHQYLNRLFHNVYGISMLQYVQKVRMEKAIGFLRAKETIPVKEIAARVGMETNYFIRMFRKSTGMTPDEYRKKRLSR